VNLHVFGNLVVGVDSNVIRFDDSVIELSDFMHYFQSSSSGGICKCHGIIYKHEDPDSMNLSSETASLAHWRYDTLYNDNAVIRHVYWALENRVITEQIPFYSDQSLKSNLQEGGYIVGDVSRSFDDDHISRTSWTLHIHQERSTGGPLRGERRFVVSGLHIADVWEIYHDAMEASASLEFDVVEDYNGIFEFKRAPISVLLSNPILGYPEGTMFVYKSYLYYKDAYGTWRKVTGETVSAF